MLKELLQQHWDMLDFAYGLKGEEFEASKLEVPEPSFITKGVSPRRDVIYLSIAGEDLLSRNDKT